MSEIESLGAEKERFQFGFAWLNMQSWTFVPHDPRIAVPQMRQVDMIFKDSIEFTKRPLPVARCKEEQFESLTNMTTFTSRNFTDFTCVDVTDLSFQGTFQDDNHTYFHFEILRCTEELLH